MIFLNGEVELLLKLSYLNIPIYLITILLGIFAISTAIIFTIIKDFVQGNYALILIGLVSLWNGIKMKKEWKF